MNSADTPPTKREAADKNEITRLLDDFQDGDAAVGSQLFKLVYKELRGRAHGMFKHEKAGHTLQATAVVHEAYLRLQGAKGSELKNRDHFFARASCVMRNILVDHARKRNSLKRGGDHYRVFLDEMIDESQKMGIEILDLEHCLTKLESTNPRWVEIAELKYIVGLTTKEIAEHLEVSPETVKRDWKLIKVWLKRELSGEEGEVNG